MNHLHRRVRIRFWTAALLIPLATLLTGCQLLGAKPTPVKIAEQPQPTATRYPTSTPLHQPAALPSGTPTPAPPAATPTERSALPELLADFPLFSGAKLDPAATFSDPGKAGVALQASQSPGELSAFYQKALKEKGWQLRYAEGSPVGGFLQEWRKEKLFLTVEYHFTENHPVVNADLRVVDSNQALALLMGFPLPNGTLVTRSAGSSIELYVPQDLSATVDFFRKQVAILRWPFEVIPPTGWCGSLGCQETMQAEYRSLVTPEPVPTQDKRKAEYYRITMPDRTQAEVTFLPHRRDTRVFINVNFKTLARSGIPVSLYPRATVTGMAPGVAMFQVKADLKDVVKFYENGMAALGWEVANPKLNGPDLYSCTWMKNPRREVSLSLSASKGMVYATLTCAACRDPYFVIPTTTPTTAPSK